jgi:hypothetical protein
MRPIAHYIPRPVSLFTENNTKSDFPKKNVHALVASDSISLTQENNFALLADSGTSSSPTAPRQLAVAIIDTKEMLNFGAECNVANP